MSALRRGFSVLQKLAQAQALSGAARASKLDEADAAFQAHFDSTTQSHLRQAYEQLEAEAKGRVDLVVTHMASLNIAERIVFAEELRRAQLQKLGLKDELNVGWSPLVRKGAEKRPEGTGLEYFGLRGFPADTIAKLLKGEFAAKIVAKPQAEKPQEEAKPQEEEKEALDIYLVGFKAETKVPLIKLVKDLLKLGLKESKDKVEEALKGPALLFKMLPKDKVKEVQKKLEDAGAKLEIK